MGRRFTPFQKKCEVCGDPFWVNSPFDRRRKYCGKPGCNKVTAFRLRQKARSDRTDAAQARAAADVHELQQQLADATVNAERERSARRLVQSDLNRAAHDVRTLLDNGILVLNADSPEWENRNDWNRGVEIVNEYAADPDTGGHEDIEVADFEREMRDLSQRLNVARTNMDGEGMRRLEAERVQRRGEFWRLHPEYWAQCEIRALEAEWARDHPGQTMATPTAEMVWYAEEARRRRARLERLRREDEERAANDDGHRPAPRR